MKVVVLGAGVAGVAAAWALWRDGHAVTVLERNPGVALETSYANGGQLSYSYVAPLASPSVIPKIPPWLLRRDSPLRFRPELDPDQWRWCIAFLAACNQRQSDLTTERLLRLAFHSRTLMRSLVAEHRIDFHYVQNGKLVVHTDPASFESACRLMDFQRSLGCEQRALSPQETIFLEPALQSMAPRIAGSIFTASEDAGDCHEFCRELERLMAEGTDPVHWRFGVEVRRLVVREGRVAAVDTSSGEVAADAFVLALGTAAPELVKPLGMRLPVYPLKGYSLTVPVTHEGGAPKVSVTDFKRKVVYARLGNELRVAGMADLAGRRAELDPERVEQLVAEARAAFPLASDWNDVEPWCGLRPATPRGTPILGPTPVPNLWLDVGHGALGFTLALAAGHVVADLVAGREPVVPLEGFRLGD